jgi:hypothetical protein
MTKVQIRFRFAKRLDDAALARLSDTTALYGIQKMKLNPSLDGMLVEYDATRLRPAEVEAAFAGAGIAVQTVA